MTLITCSECAGHVSAHAVWCPHCGAPMKRWKRALSGRRAADIYEAAGGVLIAVGVIAAVYASADAEAGSMPHVLSGITLAMGGIVFLLGYFK